HDRGRDRLDLSVGAFDSPSWFEPAHDGKPPRVSLRNPSLSRFPEHGIGAQRHSDLESVPDFDAKELWRGNANDGKQLAVESDGTIRDGRVLGEFGLPERIPDDRRRSTATRLIVFGCEDAAYGRTRAERPEEFSADKKPFRVSRLAFSCEIE